MPEVEGAGVALHYAERGTGSPLLFVHGMAGGAAEWEPALDELAAAGARAIAYDRRGYGSSGAPSPYDATTIQEQAEDAAALLEGLDGAPALLVGHGFGALIVLELLVRRPQLASAAVLVEPPLLAFVPRANEALAAERALLEAALREGGAGHAVEVWLGAGVPAERLQRARSSAAGFFADYAGQASWSPSRRELRSIDLPVAVVTGPATPSHVVAAADAAAELLSDARRGHGGDAVAAARSLLF